MEAVLGQLLAVHNVVQLLASSEQAAEFAAHALRILPGTRATAAVIDAAEVIDGEWETRIRS